MARTKTKVVKIRHGTDELASSSGENNDYSRRSSSLSEEGDYSDNSGGFAWVGSSSVELLNDSGGNMANQPDELVEAIFVSHLLIVTPRLACL